MLLLLGSALLGLPVGMMLSGLAPEDNEGARAFAGIAGIAAVPTGVLIYSSKRWKDYLQTMLEQYEADKANLRKNPDSATYREAALLSGRAYYSCLRENQLPTTYDEAAINNDMRAILGS